MAAEMKPFTTAPVNPDIISNCYMGDSMMLNGKAGLWGKQGRCHQRIVRASFSPAGGGARCFFDRRAGVQCSRHPLPLSQRLTFTVMTSPVCGGSRLILRGKFAGDPPVSGESGSIGKSPRGDLPPRPEDYSSSSRGLNTPQEALTRALNI
ncbi:hypothetical protein Bbelb_267400 [Branchiostoma belcheri]|nr:hypothetical protein Bbelb_267400 [Branchiostoma belcheri]